MAKRTGIGNVHTHHLDLRCLPENLSQQQGGYPEWYDFLDTSILGSIFLNKNERRFIRLMKRDKEDFSEVADFHIEDMDAAAIDYSVVLHIDPEGADPTAHDWNFQYEYVIDKIAQVCALQPFRFFPFFGFDPRRPNVVKMLKTNFEERCYVGIKLYPAMGFDPRPARETYCLADGDYFEHTYREYPGGGLLKGMDILSNLQQLYEYAGQNQIPILTHCSVNGSYQVTVDKNEKYKDIWRYSNPANFGPIARTYNLRICFAHMGGHIDEEENRAKAIEWNTAICELVKESDGWAGEGRLYTDQAYGIIHLVKQKKLKEALEANIRRTIGYLNDGVLGRYLLFGSDWPLNIYRCTEKEYIDEYRARLDPDQQARYFSKNIARFLFGETGRIRPNYVEYVKSRCRSQARLFVVPDWIEERNGDFYLIS
jgi:predicted TIM-barrel fold metal-dependent hydrolase